MFRITQFWTWARTLVNAVLACLGTRPAAALLSTPTIVLYSAGPAPTPDSAVADFTTVTASAVTATAVTLTGAVNLSGDVQAMIGHVDFLSTTTGTYTADTAEGYIMTNGTTTYYGGEQFAAPVNFGANGDNLSLDVIIPLPTAQTTNQP